MGGFERSFDAGVENGPVGFVVGGAGTAFLAVPGKPAPGAGRDIQPAKKRPRQEQLMKGVGARGGIRRRAVGGAGQGSIRGGIELPVIARRAFALIVKRRVKNLLAKTGELHIGQPFDLVEEIIDARRGFDVETPVVPIRVDVDESVGLRIVAIVALKKIVGLL